MEGLLTPQFRLSVQCVVLGYCLNFERILFEVSFTYRRMAMNDTDNFFQITVNFLHLYPNIYQNKLLRGGNPPQT